MNEQLLKILEAGFIIDMRAVGHEQFYQFEITVRDRSGNNARRTITKNEAADAKIACFDIILYTVNECVEMLLEIQNSGKGGVLY